MVEVGFFGAAGEVTGSMHLLDTGVDKILLDCGLFKAEERRAGKKMRTFK